MSKELSSFARRMREARVQKGIKQNQLADETGLTPQTISLYEKATEGGKGGQPTLKNAVAIAKALGVSLDWLCKLELPQLAGQDGKSLGEIARDIVLLCDNSPDVKIIEVEQERCSIDPDTGYPYSGSEITEKVPALLFDSGEIREFIAGWQRIQKLHNSKTIDDELYGLWLDKNFKPLDNKGLDGVEEEDDNLPWL